jgi:hypothetical protein
MQNLINQELPAMSDGFFREKYEDSLVRLLRYLFEDGDIDEYSLNKCQH